MFTKLHISRHPLGLSHMLILLYYTLCRQTMNQLLSIDSDVGPLEIPGTKSLPNRSQDKVQTSHSIMLTLYAHTIILIKVHLTPYDRT